MMLCLCHPHERMAPDDRDKTPVSARPDWLHACTYMQMLSALNAEEPAWLELTCKPGRAKANVQAQACSIRVSTTDCIEPQRPRASTIETMSKSADKQLCKHDVCMLRQGADGVSASQHPMSKHTYPWAAIQPQPSTLLVHQLSTM